MQIDAQVNEHHFYNVTKIMISRPKIYQSRMEVDTEQLNTLISISSITYQEDNDLRPHSSSQQISIMSLSPSDIKPTAEVNCAQKQ